ncbi:T3SS (YopN, CesT) and YbjN peptide-binding chaperone 1 [Rhodococcus erythropolis]|uniref:T3SS (YopN, CesT) and YbjN peptide-binding chaperone 1 n=1 Tax=Rhodococcus erythropolis TaxID=1833 RepID=UPI0036DAE226
MSDQDTTADQPLYINGAIALVTDERDELVRLCVQTLAELLGSEPATDDDGDIVVPVHGFVVYVTVADDGPQINVWSSVLTGLGNPSHAATRLIELAQEWPRLRFAFSGDHLLVSTMLDADPFAPQHLLNLIDEVHDFTHELDDDFAESFGGTLDCDEDDDSYAGDCNPGGCGGDCDCACGDAADAVDGELAIRAVTSTPSK